ncbi:MAG: hypothetical protein CEN88_137 [Candidatus Berkelbacteria bacterium Licking1014_2]|uniref:Membrane protein 6-pyruvoyl-tetrahydropterin synthase-related domain-containing protein n=1 Tax=Candidatus Berkelbacteria bacterium Licking1014_2 TaxID=2017146 RepID=A0A554LWC8_9BACT|nr:MAG: hypothetical protein CEN88_137 [Candidatus Berkelbacteria bacterium Licking1014_2]
MKKFVKIWPIVTIFLFSLAPTFFLWRNHQFFNNHENFFPMMRLYEFHRNIAAGYFMPRWAPDLVGGYGYPFFDFYAPLSYWLAEIFHLLNFGWIWSIKLTFIAGFLLSGLTMYWLAKELWNSRWAGVAAAVVYMSLPYHLSDTYTRGNLAESTVFIFVPLALLFFWRLINQPSFKNIICSVLSLAAIILTHNITGFYFLFILVAWILFGWWRNGRKRRALLFSGGAIVAALLLTAFFVLPALYDRRFVRTEEMLQFWYVPFRFLFSDSGDTVHFNFLRHQSYWWHWLPTLGSLSTAVFVRRFQRQRSLIFWLFLMFLILSFLMIDESQFIWQRLPQFFYFIQYTYRLLIFWGLFLSLLVGFFWLLLGRGQWRTIFLALLMVFSAALVFDRGRVDYNDLTDKDITPQLSWDWDQRWGTQGNTAQSEYLPKLVNRDGFIYKTDGLANFSWEKKIVSDKENEIIVPVFVYPGWKATINGQPTTINYDENGLLKISLPAGEHLVRVWFSSTPIRTIGGLISLLTLMAIIILWRWPKRNFFTA